MLSFMLGTMMTLNRRLRILRHRTTRWFVPPPGRRASGRLYTHEMRACEPDQPSPEPIAKRRAPFN